MTDQGRNEEESAGPGSAQKSNVEQIDRPATGADLEGGDGSFGSEGGGGDYSGVHSRHEGDPDKSDEIRG